VDDFGLTMPKQDSDRLLCAEHHLSCTYVRHEEPSPEDVAEECVCVWLPEMIGAAANPSEPTPKPSTNPPLRRQTLGSRESQKGILIPGEDGGPNIYSTLVISTEISGDFHHIPHKYPSDACDLKSHFTPSSSGLSFQNIQAPRDCAPGSSVWTNI
jgi:hypothetical protein